MRPMNIAAIALTACALVAVGATIPGSALGAAPAGPTTHGSVTGTTASTATTAAGVVTVPGDAIERMGVRVRGRATAAAVTKVTPITYHNGPVMTAPVNVYLVWYGNWATNVSTTKQILTDFTTVLGATPYWNINSTYTNAAKAPVSSTVTLQGSTVDTYSLGKTLSDAGVKTVVSSAIAASKLPADVNGIYVVLSSSDVKESSGFVTKYCGWHTRATIAATDIKFAFVGDPTTQGLSSCASQTATSPNANPGADAMVSVLAHELAEAASDPDLNAWYDAAGSENADKCAWTYGTIYKSGNGATANVKLGARDYLVQQNWKAGVTQGCGLTA